MKLKTIYQKLLLERTFDTEDSVDFIMKFCGFDAFLRDFKNNNLSEEIKKNIALGLPVEFTEVSSAMLKSADCVRAHLLNPIWIRCGIFKTGNFYKPSTKTIQISFNWNAALIHLSGDRVDGSPDIIGSFNNEITEHRIRASINHEISHWIADTLYNSQISNILKSVKEMGDDDIMKLGKKDVNMTYFEIDAQIHGIKEIKRKNENKWDYITLESLFQMYPSLGSIHREISKYGIEVSKIWQRDLVKRMYREGLLGKRMRNFVS